MNDDNDLYELIMRTPEEETTDHKMPMIITNTGVTEYLKDYKFKFLKSSYGLPIYFEKNSEQLSGETTDKINKWRNTVYFYKNPEKIENHLKLNCKPLFSAYSKYNISMGKPSQYNCIYYCHKVIEKSEIFGLMRINSSEIMPRFQFAYDSSEFTKDEIMYLIYYIFRL
jgi:hypothetical protein